MPENPYPAAAIEPNPTPQGISGISGISGKHNGDKGEGAAADNGCPEVRLPDPTAETAETSPGALCPQPQLVRGRSATNGKGEPGGFFNARGNPTADPEQYGRTARAQLEEAYQPATEKQPDAVADVPDQNFKPASSDRQPVLEGDRHREAIRARNREALQRWERRMIIDKPTS